MNYGKTEAEDLPDINSLLSSLVRLMSGYMLKPSTSRAMTLVHLMDRIDSHPDLPGNPEAIVAIRQARAIWQEELQRSRSECMCLNSQIPDDTNVH